MNLRESHWAIYFLVWLSAVVVAGALLGAITFPVAGPLFGSKLSVLEHVAAGARHLGFISFVWAPPIALVACVKRAYEKKKPRE
ncbi:MAG: hypothetical protein QM790_07880 [Nibricoccus sp.]